jgi:copper chaperone CopZ
MRILSNFVLVILLPAFASAEPPTVKVRVTGLFAKDREKELRDIFAEQLPDVKIVSVDFDHAEAVLSFEPEKVFPKVKPADVLKQIDQKVRTASSSTFTILPASTTPRDKLTRVEIGVVGLDCQACCLAAYEIVAKIDGVDQATASFKEGRITALIDPVKTEKAKLEAALKQRNVTLK